MKLLRLVYRLHREDAGQDLIEYALVLVAVAFAVVAGSGSIATALTSGLALVPAKVTTALNSIT